VRATIEPFAGNDDFIDAAGWVEAVRRGEQA
jgi:hypothetical protein